jgi:hypothetical protein
MADSKIFNGQSYRSIGWRKSKKITENRAKDLRSKGYSVRIVPASKKIGFGYITYIRKIYK